MEKKDIKSIVFYTKKGLLGKMEEIEKMEKKELVKNIFDELENVRKETDKLIIKLSNKNEKEKLILYKNFKSEYEKAIRAYTEFLRSVSNKL